MAARPIILALANPEPKIRPDCIIATGRSDCPNPVNNGLCVPYIFRGAPDSGATSITEAMKVACVREIADLAKAEFSAEGATAYRARAALRARLPDPDTLRFAADPAHRARGRQGRGSAGRRDPADRRHGRPIDSRCCAS